MNRFPKYQSSRDAEFLANGRLILIAMERVLKGVHWFRALAPVAVAAIGLASDPPKRNGPPPLPAITDANWVHFGSRLGPNGPVYTSALDPQGRLCVGGSFTHIGDLPAAGLARWDGTNWSNLGDGLVLANTWEDQSMVTALAVGPNGTLFASGAFAVEAYSNQPPGIARWNGNKWTWLTDTNGKPHSVPITWRLAADSKGGVYAVDRSAVNYWDERGFRVVGKATASVGSFIEALALDAAGALFVGGSFSNVNEIPASNVALWDGQNWRALGVGLEGEVDALLSDRPGQVFAGGDLRLPDNPTGCSVAHWDGQKWESLGARLPGLCRSLAVGADGTLYAAVVDQDINRFSSASVYAWDRTNWSRLPRSWALNRGDYAPRGRDLLNLSVDPANRLFLGGNFDPLPMMEASGLAQWDGSRWSPVGKFTPLNMDGAVSAFAAGSAGSMYVGGIFQNVGPVATGCVAEWTGKGWRTLGTGISGSQTDEFGNRLQTKVAALVMDREGGLIAGGRFTHAGGNPAANIARWNGETWSALGSGLADQVSSLAIGPDNALWAAGGFGVARWDGNEWAGVGTEADYIGQVSCLAFSPSGELVIGAYGVFRWSGTQWVRLGLPLDALIGALVFDSTGSLYVAGNEFGIDNYFHFVARHDGNGWTALVGSSGYNGLNNYPIYSLAADAHGSVYIGGRFPFKYDKFVDGYLDMGSARGVVHANNLLQWNGISIRPVAGGQPGWIYALALDSFGNLFAGGASIFTKNSESGRPGLVSQLLLAPASAIDSVESSPEGQVTLWGRGTPGYTYVLEATSQLGAEAVWTPLVTNQLSQRTFSNTDRPTGDRQFYRNRFAP